MADAVTLTGAIKELLASRELIALNVQDAQDSVTRSAQNAQKAEDSAKRSAASALSSADSATRSATSALSSADSARMSVDNALAAQRERVRVEGLVNRVAIDISDVVAEAERIQDAIDDVRSSTLQIDLAYIRAMAALYACAASIMHIEAMFLRSIELLWTHTAQIAAAEAKAARDETKIWRDETKVWRDETEIFRDEAECAMIRTRAYYDATRTLVQRAAMFSFMGAMNA